MPRHLRVLVEAVTLGEDEEAIEIDELVTDNFRVLETELF